MDDRRVKPISDVANLLFLIFLVIEMLFQVNKHHGTVEHVAYAIGLAIGVSIVPLFCFILYNSKRGAAKGIKIATIISTLLMLALVVPYHTGLFELKGQVSGNVSVHTDPANVIRPITNENIYLLKYNPQLSQECEALVNESSIQFNNMLKQHVEEYMALRDAPEMRDALTKASQEQVNRLIDDLGMRLSNRLFPYRFAQRSTDDKGFFQFSDIPRGKYYIFIQKGYYTWLVPIDLNAKAINVNLTQSNAYRLNSRSS